MENKFNKTCEEYNLQYNKTIQECLDILFNVLKEHNNKVNINKPQSFIKYPFDKDFDNVLVVTTLEIIGEEIYYYDSENEDEKFEFSDIPTDTFFRIMYQIVKNEIY